MALNFTIEQYEAQAEVYVDCEAERRHQLNKWLDPYYRNHDRAAAILGEEVGEVCKAVNERNQKELREELVQVMAVACAWIESIDANVVDFSG